MCGHCFHICSLSVVDPVVSCLDSPSGRKELLPWLLGVPPGRDSLSRREYVPKATTPSSQESSLSAILKGYFTQKCP